MVLNEEEGEKVKFFVDDACICLQACWRERTPGLRNVPPKAAKAKNIKKQTTASSADPNFAARPVLGVRCTVSITLEGGTLTLWRFGPGVECEFITT